MALSAAKSVSEFPSESLFEDFIGKAPAAAADPADPLKQLNSLGPPPASSETSDEIHARLLAEARAELTALGLL